MLQPIATLSERKISMALLAALLRSTFEPPLRFVAVLVMERQPLRMSLLPAWPYHDGTTAIAIELSHHFITALRLSWQ